MIRFWTQAISGRGGSLTEVILREGAGARLTGVRPATLLGAAKILAAPRSTLESGRSTSGAHLHRGD
jgi:hypothetical protein